MITDKDIEEAAKQSRAARFVGKCYDDYHRETYEEGFVAGASWSMDDLAKAEKKIKELKAVVADLIEQNNYHAAKMTEYKTKKEKYRKALENCNFYNEPKSASIAREALKEGEE